MALQKAIVHGIFFCVYLFVVRAYFLKEKNISQHCVNQIVTVA